MVGSDFTRKLGWFSLESGTSPCNALSVQRCSPIWPGLHVFVVHPHTLPCPRERVDTAVRLPNRTGVPSSTALSLFLSRPLHPVNRSPVEARSYGRVQRRVNANFTRSITFSTWIIRYSRRACCRHAVSRSREAGTARVDEFRTIRVRVYSNWQMEFRVRYRILSKETKILIRAILSVEQKVMESN